MLFSMSLSKVNDKVELASAREDEEEVHWSEDPSSAWMIVCDLLTHRFFSAPSHPEPRTEFLAISHMSQLDSFQICAATEYSSISGSLV